MPFDFGIPDISLQPFINAYIFYDQREPVIPQKITVTGYQFLWSILEGTVTIHHPSKGSFEVPPVAMNGHFTYACGVTQTFPCRAAAISFKPFGSHALFGLPMKTISNYFMDISNVQLGDTSLFLALKSSNNIGEIKKVFDDWLLQAMRKGLHDTALIQEIVSVIEARHGNITVEDIFKQFFITERTLQRLFSKTIGINPKLYLRIVRFNYVLSQLDNHSLVLHEIIAATGYFDQSHFIKDFLQFTGCNPSLFTKDAGNEASRETLKGILNSLQ